MSDSRNVDSVFQAAIELDSDASRAAFVREACGNDDVIRRRVNRLLAAHVQAGSFMAITEAVSPTKDPCAEQPGTMLGPFKLLEQIGEGGMGLVYMAEQQRPMRRLVALKLIKPGMDSKQVIARFEAEKQALAMMDHENIAKVFEAGMTDTGRYYFAMELVRGIPINEFCDQRRLAVRERLQLFVKVCQAVQHAHQKGIIHRDLKPSNVLVTLHDVLAVPKVIDFGIAKALGQQLTEHTLHTGFAHLVGTPLYMSPEQAEMNQLGVDTRSDVYSLGVLLYELLTGQTPFDKETLAKAGLDEMRRMIREDEPPRPSHCVRTLNAQASSTISQRRSLDERQLSHVLRNELDWIVMKALEKDRSRRYESASALAIDIERYLHDEPVQACPPSTWYRLRKFTRRHSVGLAMAVAVSAAALVAVGSLGWIAHDRQTRLGVTAQHVRETLGDVESLYHSGKLSEAVLAAKSAQGQLETGGGSEDLRQRVQDWLADLNMVDKLEDIRFRWTNNEAGYANDFHKAFRDYGVDVLTLPEAESAARIAARPIRLDLTAALDVWALGDDPAIDKERRRKLTGIARLADPDPLRDRVRDAGISEVKFEVRPVDIESQPLATLELLTTVLTRTEQRIAFLLKMHERYPDNFRVNVALGMELDAAKRYNEAVRFGTAAVVLRPQSQLAYLRLGVALRNQGSADEAMASLRTAIRLDPESVWAHNELGLALRDLKLIDEAIAAHRESIRIQPDFVTGHGNLGSALLQKGLLQEAIAAYREAIRLRPEYVMGHYNLGVALGDLGKLDEAMACYREAIRLKPDHASAHVNLGIILSKKGLIDQAIDTYREAIRLDPQSRQAHYNLGLTLLKKGESEKAIEPLHVAIRLNPHLPNAHYDLALALQARGLFDEAIVAYREALRLDPEHAEANANLGVRLVRKGLDDEGIACYREAVRLKPELHNVHFNLGRALVRKGALAEAESPFREAHERRQKVLGAGHTDTLRALDERIAVHLAQGKSAIAEPLLRERLAMHEENAPDTLNRYDCMSKLGGCLTVQRKFEEAEPLLLGGYEGVKLQMEVPGPQVIEASERLVQLYDLWGKNDKADQWRKQLEIYMLGRDSNNDKS